MKNVLLNVILVFTDTANLVDKSKHVDMRCIRKIRKKTVRHLLCCLFMDWNCDPEVPG